MVSRGSFWRGLLAGLALAALVLVGLGLAFPPLRPPDVGKGALSTPGAPVEPGVTAPHGTPTSDTAFPALPKLPATAEPAPDRIP